MTDDTSFELPPFQRKGHIQHCRRCLSGLPASQIELDSSRLAVAFYCLGSLDLLGALQTSTSDFDRQHWRRWVWSQQTRGPSGTGFISGPFIRTDNHDPDSSPVIEKSGYELPHLIMTYTALLALAILRDDFSELDRPGLLRFIRCCQREDGSFSTLPGCGEFDLRALYCAFAISNMLDDWSGMDVERALTFVASCRTYEGGYGQFRDCEAHGGTTYIAIASMYLAPEKSTKRLTNEEHLSTIQWLIRNQAASGGFCGRTEKIADACYCFWCGATLKILGRGDCVDEKHLVQFIARCQFKYGGIGKAPGEHPDPYHTYLALAALSIYPPQMPDAELTAESWNFEDLDPLLNANVETARWARKWIPIQRQST